VDAWFVLFLFCLYICVCVCLQIQDPLREYCSIRLGFCGLPYYCAPLVCVPAVIRVLSVWWYNKPNTKNRFVVHLINHLNPKETVPDRRTPLHLIWFLSFILWCTIPFNHWTKRTASTRLTTWDPKICPRPGDRSIPNGIPKHIPYECVKYLTMFLGWHVSSG